MGAGEDGSVHTSDVLRERKAEVTRQLIIEALVEIVLAGGLPGFSVQEVADRAGVSHRTVYRHFPTREALLGGLVTRIEEPTVAAGGVRLPQTANELPDAVRHNFAAFDQLADLLEASVRFRVGARVDEPQREERTRAFARSIREAFPRLDDDQTLVVAAIIRLLASAQCWLALREDAGLEGEAAGVAAGWVIQTLLDALGSEGGPSLASRSPSAPLGGAR